MLPCKLLLYLAKWFQKIFRNRQTRNKNCLWRPCLLADRDEMSNINRGHSIDASYQVLVHLANQFQRRRFLEMDQLETRIAYGGRLLTHRNEMSNIHRRPSINASYPTLVRLALWFQKRRFLEIDQLETRIVYGGMFANGLGRNEKSLEDLP